MKLPHLLAALALAALATMLLAAPGVRAQDTQTAAIEPSAPVLSSEELDQLVAPVALYSDKLLAQVLMASTYPLEIVEAERWARENASLKGDALLSALDKKTWDPSVRSLVQVPQVLKMMSDKLDWTQRLGDAFLAQQKDVMAAVQRLRGMADKAGNLKTGEQQKIVRQASAPASSGGTTVVQSAPSETIIIEDAQPDVIYVPEYNPTLVYGAWPYPAYPPYYWGAGYYGYGAPLAGAFAWGVGVGITAAVWNDAFDWRGGGVYINNNVNIHNRWRNDYNRGNWAHNAEHRRGVNYRDQATRERFGKGDHRNADARRDFRGRDGARGGGNTPRLSDRDMNRGRDANRAGRDANRANNRAGRDNQAGNRAGRNQNANRAGNRSNQAANRAGRNNQAANRGTANRQSANRQSANRGGGSRYGQQSYGGRGGAANRSYGGGGRSYGGGGRGGGYSGVGHGGQTRGFASRGGGSRGGMRGGGGRRR